MNLQCAIIGCGAWGPGFTDWDSLSSLLTSNQQPELTFTKPAPQIIPANERRRAPLLVKMAVETSWQAVSASRLSPQNVACVFGSGLGDTDITDYLCKALTTDLKQLSPTKFHNSVHNTAAGYWTISTACMEAANSIAAYQHTAGMVMLEALCQCIEQEQPVLITLYDTEVSLVLRELFPCEHNIALSLLIAPVQSGYPNPLILSVATETTANCLRPLRNPALEKIKNTNPAAQLLNLMENIAFLQRDELQKGELQQGETDNLSTCHLSISPDSSISLYLEKGL